MQLRNNARLAYFLASIIDVKILKIVISFLPDQRKYL